MQIAEIFALFKKSGSRNTVVTSDFRPEVEIRYSRFVHAPCTRP